MAEQVVPLLPVKIDMHCDHCGQGVMRPKKAVGLQSVPANGFADRKVEHVCSYCGQVEPYDNEYPKVTYVNFLDFIQDSQTVLDELKHAK